MAALGEMNFLQFLNPLLFFIEPFAPLVILVVIIQFALTLILLLYLDISQGSTPNYLISVFISLLIVPFPVFTIGIGGLAMHRTRKDPDKTLFESSISVAAASMGGVTSVMVGSFILFIANLVSYFSSGIADDLWGHMLNYTIVHFEISFLGFMASMIIFIFEEISLKKHATNFKNPRQSAIGNVQTDRSASDDNERDDPSMETEVFLVEVPPGYMQHTERVILRSLPGLPCTELKNACRASKNIYNSGNYILRKVWKARKFPLLIGKQNIRQFILPDIGLQKLYTLAKGTTRSTAADLAADAADVLETQRLLTHSELDVFVKACDALPAHTVQQLLKTLVKSWKSFFELEKDVRINPSKYDPRFKARPPQYKDKHEQWLLEFTSQDVTLQTGEDPDSPKLLAPQQPKQFAYLHFPKKRGDKFSIIPPVRVRTDIFSDHFQASGGTSFLNHVRVIPRKNQYIIEVIYLKKKHPAAVDSDKCAAVDIGVNNLMTIITNLGLSPLFLSGRVMKAINQWYNKLRAEYKSKRDVANQHKLQQLEAVRKLQKQSFVQIQAEINNRISQAPTTPEGLQLIAKQQILLSDVTHFSAKTQDELYQIRNQLNHEVYTDSKDMQAITLRRKRQIDDILHKSTTYVINYCVKHRIGKLVVGYNPEWKQDVNLGKVTNQNFVNIPFARMIDMLKYKAEMAGIDCVVPLEKYTSLCSAIDREQVGFHTHYKGRRVHRGLFESGTLNPKTQKRYVINADVNGAFNIGRHTYPHLFQNVSVQSMILRPERVEIYS